MTAGLLTDLAAVLGVALLCGAWVGVQAWVARRDPCQPGVEGRCGCKGWTAAGSAGKGGTCSRTETPPGGGATAKLVQFPSTTGKP